MAALLRHRWVLLVAGLAPVVTAAPRLELAAEIDGRYQWYSRGGHTVWLDALAGSARATFADRKGDRVNAFVLVEANQTFRSFMLHEAWARLKGPMGAWNITVGRFSVPYGLLTSFSSSRFLYQTVEAQTVGLDADNGVMVSGTVRSIEYGVAATQGYGAHRMPGFPGHGLGAGRIGLILGEYDNIVVGVSAAHGRTETEGHSAEHDAAPVRRTMFGVDLSLFPGRLTLRAEAGGGWRDGNSAGAGVLLADYAFHRLFDGTVAAKYTVVNLDHQPGFFGGVGFNHVWVTIRGGYGYERRHEHWEHRVALQVFRRFRTAF